MLTSLFSLFYVTCEFHRFLHRGRANDYVVLHAPGCGSLVILHVGCRSQSCRMCFLNSFVQNISTVSFGSNSVKGSHFKFVSV